MTSLSLRALLEGEADGFCPHCRILRAVDPATGLLASHILGASQAMTSPCAGSHEPPADTPDGEDSLAAFSSTAPSAYCRWCKTDQQYGPWPGCGGIFYRHYTDAGGTCIGSAHYITD